jgi:RNA recognition motif-containing protein
VFSSVRSVPNSRVEMSPVGSKSSQVVSRLKRKRDPSPDSSDTSSSSSEPEQIDDVPVLSHAARRKQKKKALLKEAAPTGSPTKKQKKEEEEFSHSAKRQNSVWVGNLCYKTTQESLQRFFGGVGEITRVHLPTKLGKESPGAPARRENRGCVCFCRLVSVCLHGTPGADSFAYVDFATLDAKKVAITMSESPLDGRRLLIKDGA